MGRKIHEAKIEKGVRSHLIVPILSENGAGNDLGVSKTAQSGV
jgi:hypothetical protein